MFVKGCSIDYFEYMESETNVVFLPHIFSGVSSQKWTLHLNLKNITTGVEVLGDHGYP